jgi:hypothetical protein
VSVPDAGKIIIVIGVTVAAPSQSCHPQRATLKWERLPSIHQPAFDGTWEREKFSEPTISRKRHSSTGCRVAVRAESFQSLCESNDSFQNIRRADTAIAAASKEKAEVDVEKQYASQPTEYQLHRLFQHLSDHTAIAEHVCRTCLLVLNIRTGATCSTKVAYFGSSLFSAPLLLFLPFLRRRRRRLPGARWWYIFKPSQSRLF